jgi:dipeptidyl aminopeptidase/acylaminoacyl peptidase
MMKKRRLQLEDLLSVEYLSDAAVSPNGQEALYVVHLADRATGKLIPHVWQAKTDGSGHGLLLPDAPFAQKQPRYAVDGQSIYLLCDREEPGVWQLYVFRNGELTQLTHMRHGVSWYAVSQDGRHLTFTVPLWMEGTAPGDCRENAMESLTGEERRRWQEKKDRQPIVTEELMYKFDETFGIPDGSIDQIGVVDLTDASVQLLTWENCQHGKPVLSPDGSKVACWRKPHHGWKKLQGDLAVYNLSDGSCITLVESSMCQTDAAPIWMDDQHLLYSAYAVDDGYMHGAFYTVEATSGAEPKRFGPTEPEWWGPGTLVTGHTAYGSAGETSCLKNGRLYFSTSCKGAVDVYAMKDDGESTICLTDGKCVHSFAISADKLVIVKGDFTHLMELYAKDLSTGEEICIAKHNAWMDEVLCTEQQEMTIPSAHDGLPVRGWVMKPYGWQEGKHYPAVLDVHGGPECHYPIDWWFEFHYLASRGMAVVWCDPHGSTSFGKAYQEGAWDGIAYHDLMDFLTAAEKLGFIDDSRCGVTGGSYGGFMTNYIVGTTHRFAAAVTQRNLCNRATSYGTGDMGTIMKKDFISAYDSLMDRVHSESSTIRTVDQVTTPLLILHATNDYRCSFEQGEQFFAAMKKRRSDVPVRFAAFPGENHGLTREGNVYAQMGHLREMADWFTKYLQAEEVTQDD